MPKYPCDCDAGMVVATADALSPLKLFSVRTSSNNRAFAFNQRATATHTALHNRQRETHDLDGVAIKAAKVVKAKKVGVKRKR